MYLQRLADCVFEVVYGDEIREEWENVFNFDQVALLHELHSLLHIFFFFDNMTS